VDCSTSTSAISVGSPFGSAMAGNLPANYTSISSTGSPVEVGVFRAGSGLKVLDPFGHYYLYCRWENGIGNANAIAIISAGPSGRVQTKCGDSAAGGDNLLVVWTTAVTQNRAAVWQTTTAGSAVTGAQFGATGTQVSIGTNGNVIIPGTLDVSGATTLSSSLTATGITNTPVSGSTGSFTSLAVGGSGQMTTDNSGNVNTTGTLGVSGLSTLGLLSAGSSTMSSATVTGDVAVGGTLGVTGDTTLGALTAGTSTLASASVTGSTFLGGNLTTATAMIQIGTTVALGSSVPLLVVGKPVGAPAVYPFTVDQNGNAFGSTFSGSFSGNLSGSQSGGSVSATSLSASGATTLSGALTGTSAHFTGTLHARKQFGPGACPDRHNYAKPDAIPQRADVVGDASGAARQVGVDVCSCIKSPIIVGVDSIIADVGKWPVLSGAGAPGKSPQLDLKANFAAGVFAKSSFVGSRPQLAVRDPTCISMHSLSELAAPCYGHVHEIIDQKKRTLD
jgi:hypothetical protein